MTNLAEDIHIDYVFEKMRASSQKNVFQNVARTVAPQLGLQESELLRALIDKEASCPSGIGDGIAIAHVRLKKIVSKFITLAFLERPVNFNSADNKPVNMVCVLASPAHEHGIHLRRLSRLSRLLKNKILQASIRDAAHDLKAVSTILQMPEEWMMAA